MRQISRPALALADVHSSQLVAPWLMNHVHRKAQRQNVRVGLAAIERKRGIATAHRARFIPPPRFNHCWLPAEKKRNFRTFAANPQPWFCRYLVPPRIRQHDVQAQQCQRQLDSGRLTGKVAVETQLF
jgi:hypothetical protein